MLLGLAATETATANTWQEHGKSMTRAVTPFNGYGLITRLASLQQLTMRHAPYRGPSPVTTSGSPPTRDHVLRKGSRVDGYWGPAQGLQG
jgi:hypothetical protein